MSIVAGWFVCFWFYCTMPEQQKQKKIYHNANFLFYFFHKNITTQLFLWLPIFKDIAILSHFCFSSHIHLAKTTNNNISTILKTIVVKWFCPIFSILFLT